MTELTWIFLQRALPQLKNLRFLVVTRNDNSVYILLYIIVLCNQRSWMSFGKLCIECLSRYLTIWQFTLLSILQLHMRDLLYYYHNMPGTILLFNILTYLKLLVYFGYRISDETQIFKLPPKRHIFFDLVIRFITNRKYAFFCIF